MVRPQNEYRIVLKPSVDYLVASNRLLIGAQAMGEFLGISRLKVHQLMGTERIPLPVKLGVFETPRWSVLELLQWVEAGCPRRTVWIEQHGWSGWMRQRNPELLW